MNTINYSNYNITTFKSAADISIKYALEKRSHLLPERIKHEIIKALRERDGNLPKLYELHEEVYRPLLNAETLDSAKSSYSEFNDVLELTALDGNRSKALKAVKKIMPLEKFSLDLLKKLYAPETMEQIVTDYNFTNRSLLNWLMDRLNIPKLSGNYIKLLKMSDEKENSRVAEIARAAMKRESAETKAYREQRAAEGVRTEKFKEYKRKQMIQFYKDHPEHREKVREISSIAWGLVPDLRKEFSDYTMSVSPYIRKVLSNKRTGKKLTEYDKRIYKSFYKGFWKDPSRRERMSQAKIQAAEIYNSLYESIK